MNRRIDPEIARVESVESQTFTVHTRNFEAREVAQVYLSFLLDGRPFFMAAPWVENLDNDRVRLALPAVIFEAERRSRVRQGVGAPTRWVELQVPGGPAVRSKVRDWSPEGLAVALPAEQASEFVDGVHIYPLDGPIAGQHLHGEVRYRTGTTDGLVRVGIDVSVAPRGRLRIEEREAIVPASGLARTQRRWKVLGAGLRIAAGRALRRIGLDKATPPVHTVDYTNEKGERIRAILDSWGPTRGAVAVVIPPAWGRTKETLAPLAACIIEGFRRAGQAVVVVRFDGIRKKGESHNEPECREPGHDHHRFTFSQGVRDIQATLNYLDRDETLRPEQVFLVSFSAASIESRRAVRLDPRLRGWISVVGSADLQSMMRVISGGIDFGVGYERGLRFGYQEILGIEVDMDHAGLDAIEHELGYLEDARRDFAAIDRPITWIHGRYDAWMDLDRVRDALSRGNPTGRKLIEVPTGHMLKTSREALETFQLIVRELGQMALGREIEAGLPPLTEIERRMRAERERLPRPNRDLRAFWTEYLLGRDRSVGIELMTSITPYEDLMEVQVGELDLGDGERVVDLGAGTGAFPRYLDSAASRPPNVAVVELDFVRAAFERAQRSPMKSDTAAALRVTSVECNLDVRDGGLSIPLATASADAVLASLFLSYVAAPEAALREARRLLRPGGRLVVSSLRRDADMSKLFSEGLEELRAGRARERLGIEAEAALDDAGRSYLNQASRLLGLEDEGVFRFWDPEELEALVRRAGFVDVRSRRTFGNPPQAVVVSARRP